MESVVCWDTGMKNVAMASMMWTSWSGGISYWQMEAVAEEEEDQGAVALVAILAQVKTLSVGVDVGMMMVLDEEGVEALTYPWKAGVLMMCSKAPKIRNVTTGRYQQRLLRVKMFVLQMEVCFAKGLLLIQSKIMQMSSIRKRWRER